MKNNNFKEVTYFFPFYISLKHLRILGKKYIYLIWTHIHPFQFNPNKLHMYVRVRMFGPGVCVSVLLHEGNLFFGSDNPLHTHTQTHSSTFANIKTALLTYVSPYIVGFISLSEKKRNSWRQKFSFSWTDIIYFKNVNWPS